MVQIFADAKLNRLIYNGDWGDYNALGTHPGGWRPDLATWRREVEEQRTLLKQAQASIKPKQTFWNDGNHEWRILRAFERDPKLARTVLQMEVEDPSNIKRVADAFSMPSIFGFAKLGIKYSGTYPKGCWLKDGLDPHDNVYVHHGYTARKKSGFTISGQMDDHWASQVVGHCERLAGPIWNRKLGRDYFGIENGNCSLIGEPGLGEDIYAGIPHSDPKLMNHRQGLSILYYAERSWWPFTIKIRDGKAVWNGKVYRA